jgi:hypothetical protein
VLHLDDFLSDQIGFVSTASSHACNGSFELLLGGRTSEVMPQIIVADPAAILSEDFRDDLPIVPKTTNRARVIQKDGILLLLHFDYYYNFLLLGSHLS